MPFSLAQLATFVRLAADPSFTRTAEQLGLTQPAVTHQIRTLERDLGVRLVDVVARRAELTEAGAYLAERGRRLVAEAAAFERDARELADARTGALHLGATLTIGAALLPQVLAAFKAARPKIAVTVEIANTAAVADMVADGRLSAGLVEGSVVHDELAVEPFAEDELILIAPPQHPLAGRTASAGEIAAQPFVGREPGSGTREVLESALASRGLTLHYALVLPSSEGIVRSVACGLGIAALSKLLIADPLREGRVVALRVPGLDLRRSLSFVRRKATTPSPALRAFREVLSG